MRRWILLVVLGTLLNACAQPQVRVASPTSPAATFTPSPTQTVLLQSIASQTAPPATATTTNIPSLTLTPVLVPSQTATQAATLTPSPTKTALPVPTETALPSATATQPPPTQTSIPASPIPSTATATIAPVAMGQACLRPPENYQRITLGRHTVSARTAAMLDNAQSLYGGRGSMRLLVQGSYAPGLDASFGTHDGGGAVDVWTVDPNDTSQLLTDIPQMVTALRQAGFAAWYRPANMLYQGMSPHIHAIAVGDAELSAGALDQLTGEYGYFQGRNGLPQPEFAGPDPHGGPVLCDWMREMGYTTALPAPPTATIAAAVACQPPIADYTRVTINGHTLSRRTHIMLQTAQDLYGGPGNLLNVTQGSYNIGTAASFGTHDGGGAVDISIRHPTTGAFLVEETDAMVRALRQAGFAAWYRAPGDLGPNSAPHLHAIAIGDADLSEAAAAQLTGEQGYFRGRNGLPQSEYAAPDRHGGPIICDWMIETGYTGLR